MAEPTGDASVLILDPDPVLNKMLQQETGQGPHAKPPLMVGLGVCIVLIPLLALITVVLVNVLNVPISIGWYGWVLVWFLIFGGLAFWVDRKTRGQRWADSTLVGPLVHPWIDAIIFPIRFIVGGYQRTNSKPATRDYLALTRCAMLIRDLADEAGSAPLVRVAKPGETPAYLDILVDHLSSRDWVGHSSDRQRIWLSSSAKADMIRWNLATVPFS